MALITSVRPQILSQDGGDWQQVAGGSRNGRDGSTPPLPCVTTATFAAVALPLPRVSTAARPSDSAFALRCSSGHTDATVRRPFDLLWSSLKLHITSPD